jgi:predicted membrane protein
MVMRFRLNLMLLSLLVTLAMPIGLAAQEGPSQTLQSVQAALNPGGSQTDCLERPGFQLRRPGVPAIMNRPCKPVLDGTGSSQPSNELARPAGGGTYITFDVSGSSGTSVAGINLWGTIAGSYGDANSPSHGFLRRLTGDITTFDVPGSVDTSAMAINDAGEITGTYDDADFLTHGFLRRANGAITTFDVPGSFATVPYAINDAGAIAGVYGDENFVGHGFVRNAQGAITTFDVPGAVNGTFPVGLNLLGNTTGLYFDENFLDRGFVRSPNGAITTFDVLSGQPADAFGINLLGIVTGQFREQHPEVHFHLWRGFIRKFDGTIETFDAVADPLHPCCTWTTPSSINLAGEVVGTDNDAHTLNHGFLRDRNGAITILDAPGAGTGFDQGTFAVSINLFGVVAGNYTDSNRVSHGFLWVRN